MHLKIFLFVTHSFNEILIFEGQIQWLPLFLDSFSEISCDLVIDNVPLD